MIKRLKSGYWAVYSGPKKVVTVRLSAVAIEIDRAVSQLTSTRASRLLHSKPSDLAEYLDQRYLLDS